MLALSALLLGCTQARPGPTPRTPVATPTPSGMAQLRLPINRYVQTAEEEATSEYLTYRVEQTCMRGFGFRYLPHLSTDYISRAVAVRREYESRRYGISDRAIAAERGYHLSPASAGGRMPQNINTLSTAERAALSGRTGDGSGPAPSVRGRPVPSGGCAGQAARTVQGDSASNEARQGHDLVVRLRHELFLESRTDPRVTAVDREWSACMSEKGFRYRDPDAAIGDSRWNLQSDAPSRGEIAVARADIACKLRTNLLGVNFAVEAEYQNAAVSDHAEELSTLLEHRNAESGRLPRLMAQYGTPPA
ncbi:hypothetical protein [Streptomyces sp. NPDC020571]|uniref:hypothetical protein n=1 Tax=Streptomyces sp. NPDC020571 TaxID=3365079 RepID=UPI0037BD63F8